MEEKQDKEEKAARKQGGGCLLVEQIKGPAFKEAVYRETLRPNRPFRTIPPRLVPAGALLYIVPAFLGNYRVSQKKVYNKRGRRDCPFFLPS